jgi:hypothetical protein
MNRLLVIVILSLTVLSCSENEIEKKGFQISEINEDENGKKIVGLRIDSLALETRPRNVILTKNRRHRLTPIYKINYNKKTGKPYTGSNNFHNHWVYEQNDSNSWHENFMPGFEAIYGYNFVNVSHYNNETKTQNEFFNTPVLIKTLYYPAFSNDTLNHIHVNRNYYMVSVYDEDSNNDGFISVKDLRRFYLFDIDGFKIKSLIPMNYSVMNSEYDSENDYMYIFAAIDVNKNGQIDQNESIHIFWIDLKNPENVGIQYQNK